MSIEKQAAASVVDAVMPTAIGGRIFTRVRGKEVCYFRETYALRREPVVMEDRALVPQFPNRTTT